jgi:hypothetical protein
MSITLIIDMRDFPASFDTTEIVSPFASKLEAAPDEKLSLRP